MDTDRYGLPRRSAVRNRRLKRLRALATIVALAVIWLGYSVAHQTAKPLAAPLAVELQSSSGTSTVLGASTTDSQVPRSRASVENALPTVSSLTNADLPLTRLEGTPDSAEAVPATSEEPPALSQVPFLQAALSDSQAGSGPAGHARAFGGGTAPMWGSGGAGGAESADSPVSVDDTELSDDGKVSVLGKRFLADSGEPSEGTASNENSAHGSNGSNADNNGSSGGSASSGSSAGPNVDNSAHDNASNGTASNGTGSNGNASNDHNEAGNRNDGKDVADGSKGASGTDQDAVADDSSNSLAVGLADDTPTTGGDVRDVPEPGSILVGLGLAALVRRSAAHKRRR